MIDGFGSQEDMLKAFEEPSNALDGCNVIVASYGCGDYEGDAFVLYEQGNELWLVTGRHCSCYGLEGQWDPQNVTKDTLRFQVENGTHPLRGGYCDHSKEVADAYDKYLDRT